MLDHADQLAFANASFGSKAAFPNVTFGWVADSASAWRPSRLSRRGRGFRREPNAKTAIPRIQTETPPVLDSLVGSAGRFHHGGMPLPLDEQNKLNIAYMEQVFAMAHARFRVISDLALQGVRTLLLLNGGAAVALFAVVSHDARAHLPGPALTTTFGWFAAGAVLSLVSLLVGYVSQNMCWNFELQAAFDVYHTASGHEARSIKIPWYVNPIWGVAVLLAFLSLVAFIAGAHAALIAMTYS